MPNVWTVGGCVPAPPQKTGSLALGWGHTILQTATRGAAAVLCRLQVVRRAAPDNKTAQSSSASKTAQRLTVGCREIKTTTRTLAAQHDSLHRTPLQLFFNINDFILRNKRAFAFLEVKVSDLVRSFTSKTLLLVPTLRYPTQCRETLEQRLYARHLATKSAPRAERGSDLRI